MNRKERFGLLLSLYDKLAETLNEPSSGLEVAGTGLTRMRKGGAERMDSISVMHWSLNYRTKVVFMHTHLSLVLVISQDGTIACQRRDWGIFMTYSKLTIPASLDGTLQSISQKVWQVWNCLLEPGVFGTQEIFLPSTVRHRLPSYGSE